MMAILATFLVFNAVAQTVAKFDDLTLAPEKFWNGSDLLENFKSAGITFYNTYTKSIYGDYWNGFAYSNTTDVTTAGYSNQYSAITGKAMKVAPIMLFVIQFLQPNLGSVIQPKQAVFTLRTLLMTISR